MPDAFRSEVDEFESPISDLVHYRFYMQVISKAHLHALPDDLGEVFDMIEQDLIEHMGGCVRSVAIYEFADDWRVVAVNDR